MYNETENQTSDNSTIVTSEGSSTVELLELMVPPIFYFAGLLGNIFSFFIFISNHSNYKTTSYYLAGLSAVDAYFIFTLIISTFWPDLANVEGFCQLIHFSNYVSSGLSAWFVVVFTIERYLAVIYPLRHRIWCTVSRTRLVVFSLVLAALGFYLLIFWFTGVVVIDGQHHCTLKLKYLNAMEIFNAIEFAFTGVLPMIVIFTLNVLIILKMNSLGEHFSLAASRGGMGVSRGRSMETSVVSVDRRSQFYATSIKRTANDDEANYGDDSSASPRNNNKSNRSNNNSNNSSSNSHSSYQETLTKTQRSITVTLLLISISFIVLNFPSHLMRIYTYMYYIPGQRGHPVLRIVQKIANYMYYGNFCINFLLYAVGGRNFRMLVSKTVNKKAEMVKKYFSNAVNESEQISQPFKKPSANQSTNQGKSTPSG